MNARAPRHWTREPYVWLLIALPLSAVIGGIATAVLAVRSDDGLVVDDYYKRGLEINQTLDRDRRAAQAGLSASLRWSETGTGLTVILDGNAAFAAPAAITVTFLNATRAGLDRTLVMNRTGGGSYAADTPPLASGRWYVQIEGADWRLLQPLRID